VQTPEDVPPVENLLSELEGQVPNGFGVVVSTSVGREIDVGTIGAD
jgi:hypothetical protein